jgi:hypothetical protein
MAGFHVRKAILMNVSVVCNNFDVNLADEFDTFLGLLRDAIKEAVYAYNRALISTKGFGTWSGIKQSTIDFKEKLGLSTDVHVATGKLKSILSSEDIVTETKTSVCVCIKTYSDESWAFDKGSDVLGKLESFGRMFFIREALERSLEQINIL